MNKTNKKFLKQLSRKERKVFYDAAKRLCKDAIAAFDAVPSGDAICDYIELIADKAIDYSFKPEMKL